MFYCPCYYLLRSTILFLKTICVVRTPAWMDSATKNAHMRKIARFNLYFLSFPPPLLICLPLALLFLSLISFLPPLGENYRRIYSPDSLLSCIIILIPKFISSFQLAPLSIFFIYFPVIFLLLLPFSLYSSFLFLPFPIFLPFPLLFFLSFLSLLFHSSLIS